MPFFKIGAQHLIVKAPTSANVLPPRHYFLFLLNEAGVPSIAKILRAT
ncbi:galactose oxidase-like domain-containing protein [Candidatus Cyanaurora vandensis]